MEVGSIPPQSLRSEVHKALKSLNPNLKGLIDMHGSNVEQVGKVRTMKMGSALNRPPIKRSNNGTIEFGKEIPVFVAEGSQYRLDRLFIFTDGSLRIGTHEPFVNLEQISNAFLNGRLATQIPDGSRVAIDGLGSFTTGRGSWEARPEERIREIQSVMAELGGAPNPISVCIKAFDQYEKEPTETNRNTLRAAYEAVPEHLRMYCGDMDSKDYPIQQALSEGDNEAANS